MALNRAQLREMFERMDRQADTLRRTRERLSVAIRDYSSAEGYTFPLSFENARREVFQEEDANG